MAVASNGSWLATTSNDQTIRVWDPASPQTVTLTRAKESLQDCFWMPDGQGMAAVGLHGVYLYTYLRGTTAP